MIRNREKPENNKKKQPSAAVIEQTLTDQITAGELHPGQRIDAAKLAEHFGVSRTPVREALARLTAQGILVSEPRRGVHVAEYSQDELSQIFETMHEIETACARLAALRLTLLSRSEIKSAQEKCLAAAEKGDITEYLHANEAFHQTIYKATGNPYMADLAMDFRRRTGPVRAKKFASQADLIESAESHQELMAHIFSEDSQTASQGMRAHMANSFVQTLTANR